MVMNYRLKMEALNKKSRCVMIAEKLLIHQISIAPVMNANTSYAKHVLRFSSMKHTIKRRGSNLASSIAFKQKTMVMAQIPQNTVIVLKPAPKASKMNQLSQQHRKEVD